MTLYNNQAELIWRRPFRPSMPIAEYTAWPAYRLDGRRLEPEECPLLLALHQGKVTINQQVEIMRGDGSRGTILVSSGDWNLAGMATIQSGTALTIAYTNANNVFGISEDRAQLAPGCTARQLVAEGPVNSRLNHFFSGSCFTTPSVIGRWCRYSFWQ